LTVVPTITEEGTVVLKLNPEVSTDTGDFTVPTASGSVTTAFNRTIPIIATQSLETTVIVKSGETLVVGGLIKDSESKLQRKLPLLGDIPILGALFRSEQIDFRKTELVIFLTPHIISGDYSTREYGKFFNSEHQLIDFDKVGGFDYGRAQEHSQGPFRKDKKPYWEVDGWEIPQYLPEKNLHTRIEPYEDRMDQFEGFKEGDVVLDRQTLLGSYQAFVTETVRQSIKAFKELESFKGTLDIALLIRRDGVVEDASFVGGRANGLENRKLKRQIVKRLKHETKFPEFPKGLDSQNEMFLVTLASQGENAPPKD
ncbi:MAG: type II and III secretion system protein, partial [Candidatus Omnitrophica bacterium]|nr:type II and III secretion system protein [Candidatus Omnitrophota bacterium]